jgi:hypothetical protein
MKIDDRNWSALSLGERIRQVELEGYVVIPDLLSPDHITRLKAQADRFETVGRDYSERQRGRANIQFEGGAITELIAHPPTIAFLREVFGDEIVFVSYSYDRSEPGTPGISLHTDGQPYGSKIFGYNGSCPFLIRVLYYLDDLTPDISPFRVVPRSHLCMHADANPYKRYESHPEQVIVPCRAGSAVFLNHRTFHGTCPNIGDHPRAMLAIAYRPAWAGPIAEVPGWNLADLEKLPPSVRPFFKDPNTRYWDFDVPNKPAFMASEAPGMNPSRWERKGQ